MKPTGNKNGRPKGRVKTHCRQGHPRTPENLWGSNCRTCTNERRRIEREIAATTKLKRRGRTRERLVMVPAAPVFELLDRLEISIKQFGFQYARLTGAQPETGSRAMWRAREAGEMTIDAADTACIALGRHPYEVYGHVWFTYGNEVADAV